MTRVLILVNSTGSKPGLLVPWLLGRDVEFDVRVGPVSGSPTPDDLEGYDGLVLLGGGYMPDEVGRGPWLAGEADLTRAALARGTPLFGICLGGQMLAHVGGGTVAAKTGVPEKGLTPITITAAAENDPVFSAVPKETAFIESHVDRITALPPGAVLLASSEACEFQAFRLGPVAWGTQFHPEVSAENVRGWDAAELATLGFDKETLVAEAEAADAAMRRDAEALVGAWVEVVRSRV
jgi:GMP synthase (glutamine-hydrolysing)